MYLPASDTLVTKQYLINGIVRSLVVYKNFTKRLTRVSDGSVTSYNFDSTNPDYIFKSTDGYAWPVAGVGASSDGKWVGVEFRQKGIGLLNIDTLEMKRISTLAFTYGQGLDPATEIAVSNGGKQVVVAGTKADMTIIEVDDSCGDEATDANLFSVGPIEIPCRIVDFNPYDLIYRFNSALGPRFSESGGELNFYVTSYNHEMREIVLRAAGYGGQRIDYLALGDSYSSGEGETSDKYYLPWTNEKYEKCHLSSRSYPYLVAKASNIDSKYMRSVACSGATTKDIVNVEATYMGQNNRLGKNELGIEGVDAVVAKTYARINFIPGRIPQEGFVEFYKPKVITIGVGGNDAELINKLGACARPGAACGWVGDSKKKEQTAYEIKAVYDKLVAAYRKLHINSPDAIIYAIGYPKVINEGDECSAVLNQFLDKPERIFMNESVKYLNEIIESAAKAAGIKYVDIYESFGDKVICGSKSPSAVNLVRTGDEISLLGDSDWFKYAGNESFHPSPAGNKMIADIITKELGDILSYKYCANGEIICPDKIVTAPDPVNLSYWMPEGDHNYAAQKAADFVSDCDKTCGESDKQLKLDPSSLMPNSSVEIEIQSTPQNLGNFVVNSDGSLDTTVKLPLDLEEGLHTIWLYGTTYSGEPIELYQIIRYVKNNEKSKFSRAVSAVASQKENIKQKSQTKNAQLISNANYNVTINGSIASPPEVKGATSVASPPRGTGSESYGENKQLWRQIAVLGVLFIVGLAIYLFKFKLNKNKFKSK